MAQIMHLGVPIGGTVVENILTSTSTTNALSANQGRVLNEKNETLATTVNQNWQGNGYNLMPYPYEFTNTTNRGINFVSQNDGSIIANGTVSETTLDAFASVTQTFTLKSGTYRIIDGIADSSDTKYWCTVYRASSGAELQRSTRGELFTLTSDTNVYVQARVYRGTTVSNITFKPMIVEVNADGTYPTEYQRYGMGNVELQNTIEGVSGGDEWLASKAYSVNAYVIYQNKLYRCKANTTSGILPTNTTYWEQVSISSLNQSFANIFIMRKVVFPSGLLLSENQHRIYEITSLLPTISGYAPFALVNAYYYGSANIITQLNDLEYNQATGAPHYVRLLMINTTAVTITSDGEHYYFNMYYRKI